MKPGDEVILYSNPVNSMKESAPMRVRLISKKGDVKNLWVVKMLDTGETCIRFVHEPINQTAVSPLVLRVIEGGKKI